MLAHHVKHIAYHRVSTKRQGESGLGLDAQRTAVTDYLHRNEGVLVAEYTEIESGKVKDRPELQRAIAHAKRAKARLVVAKLDRLARNVAFTSALMESGIDFIACDNPHANRLTIHILAAVAEDEARRISERTKAALDAAKRRGVRLGSARPGHWMGHEAQRAAGLAAARIRAATSHKAAARDAYADLLPMIQRERYAGRSLRQIAVALNEAGHVTRWGKPWRAAQVSRVLKLA